MIREWVCSCGRRDNLDVGGDVFVKQWWSQTAHLAKYPDHEWWVEHDGTPVLELAAKKRREARAASCPGGKPE